MWNLKAKKKNPHQIHRKRDQICGTKGMELRGKELEEGVY